MDAETRPSQAVKPGAWVEDIARMRERFLDEVTSPDVLAGDAVRREEVGVRLDTLCEYAENMAYLAATALSGVGSEGHAVIAHGIGDDRMTLTLLSPVAAPEEAQKAMRGALDAIAGRYSAVLEGVVATFAGLAKAVADGKVTPVLQAACASGDPKMVASALMQVGK